MKKKVLIIEDEAPYFIPLFKSLSNRLSDLVDFFPYPSTEVVGLKNWDELIDTAINGETGFNQIAETYKDVDLFVIDLCLVTASKDDSGMAFWNYAKKRFPKAKFVILTSSPISPEELRGGTERFVSKIQSKTYINDQVLEEICVLLGIKTEFQSKTQPLSQKQVDREAGITDTGTEKSGSKTDTTDKDTNTNSNPSLWQNLDTPLDDFSFNELRKTFGLCYAMHRWFKRQQANAARAVDFIIKIFFVILILGACWYALHHIFPGFVAQEENKGQKVNELYVAEHVFLYLLPVFIVFGFFIYYKTNMSLYLTGGNINKIKESSSTRAMTLTKTLFIGSLISYLIVKAVELVTPGTKAEEPSLKMLICMGVLIVLLMAYFIILEKLNHHDD